MPEPPAEHSSSKLAQVHASYACTLLQVHRLKEVIRRAGELAGRPLKGVWSPAGRAYDSLGVLEEVGAGAGWVAAGG
jgi:hypothetical protein